MPGERGNGGWDLRWIGFVEGKTNQGGREGGKRNKGEPGKKEKKEDERARGKEKRQASLLRLPRQQNNKGGVGCFYFF